MIRIKHNEHKIVIDGHSKPEICAAVSSIMYTCVNVLSVYDEDCIGFLDDGNTVEVNFKKENDLIPIVKQVFLAEINDLLEDLEETGERDCLSVEYIK